MIVVTGAAGFIGSNIIRGLNQIGITDILAVDDLTDGKKYRNLAVVHYQDYMDFRLFLSKIENNESFNSKITAIFHEGACSDTMEWNGEHMMKNNYDYTKTVFHYCLENSIQFLYASSAAVYGSKNNFDDQDWDQLPLNVYGYSKWKFDEYVRPYLKTAKSQIVGFRYFNVYGPHENHKGKMASVAFHLMNQLEKDGTVKLFSSYGGYGDGAHERDFIFIDDVVKMNLWFLKHSDKSGIFNCGTGLARCFNAIAKTLIELKGSGELAYIPFPESLKGAYQCFTQANLTALRDCGFTEPFTSLEEGLQKYFHWYHDAGKFHRG
ncbi:MAG: ADP-glyceromanno-heptose 6-epimerase [Coxiellaceae bacterium]|nr:ADP-glyceromanno-heptose 6-epimerase [Coxiellaceae bacterium]